MSIGRNILSVAQLRREPMLARAMDLVLQEAERAGEEDVVLRDSAAELSEVTRWALGRYAAEAERETVNFAYLAALYRMCALLGEDVSVLWAWYEGEEVRAEVRASLYAACAPRADDAKVHAKGFPGLGPPTLCGEAGPVNPGCGEITCSGCLDVLANSASLAARMLEIEFPVAQRFRAALTEALRVTGDDRGGFVARLYYDGSPIARVGQLREELGQAEGDAKALTNGLLLVIVECMATIYGEKGETERPSSHPAGGAP